MQKFDLFVLGTGPAGQRAAVQAAKLGKKVGICEKREMVGGVCVNTGTIPSKTFREAVLYLSGIAQRANYGASYTIKDDITMEDLLLRCRQVITREIEVIRSQMKRNGIALLGGAATFTGPHTLTVAGLAGTLEVEAEKIVIAVGTKPSPPPVPVDGETVIDSDGILSLKRLPKSLIVVGGGVIGVEYASMFAAGHVAVTLKSGKKIGADLLLYSIGRIGATVTLGLASAGLEPDDRGRLKVNENYQTAQTHIYAVGDVIGFPALASTSMEQGRLASCHAFGVSCHSLPHLYPIGIYSVPEISMVGKTEEELTKESVPYETGVARYREIARGAIVGDDTGILKILVHRETRLILGVHILGTAATELVHIGQSFLSLGGTLDVLVDTVFNYPTFAECYKVAALDAYNKLRADAAG